MYVCLKPRKAQFFSFVHLKASSRKSEPCSQCQTDSEVLSPDEGFRNIYIGAPQMLVPEKNFSDLHLML